MLSILKTFCGVRVMIVGKLSSLHAAQPSEISLVLAYAFPREASLKDTSLSLSRIPMLHLGENSIFVWKRRFWIQQLWSYKRMVMLLGLSTVGERDLLLFLKQREGTGEFLTPSGSSRKGFIRLFPRGMERLIFWTPLVLGMRS